SQGYASRSHSGSSSSAGKAIVSGWVTAGVVGPVALGSAVPAHATRENANAMIRAPVQCKPARVPGRFTSLSAVDRHAGLAVVGQRAGPGCPLTVDGEVNPCGQGLAGAIGKQNL